MARITKRSMVLLKGAEGQVPTIAIIPIGTGNDWAKSLRIRTASRALEHIVAGHTIRHNAGIIEFDDRDPEYFINVAGMCLDAEVISILSRKLLKRFGKGAYIMGGLRALSAHKPYATSVQLDTDTIETHLVTLHAGVGRFCGGGMQFTPHAHYSGETMAVTLIHATSKWRLIGNMHRLYTNSISGFRSAHMTHSRQIAVSHDQRPIPVEADGEFIGYSPCAIRCIPDALEVIAPESHFKNS